MRVIGKILVLSVLALCILAGVVLFTGHPGFVIKISNYLFFLLSVGLISNYFQND